MLLVNITTQARGEQEAKGFVNRQPGRGHWRVSTHQERVHPRVLGCVGRPTDIVRCSIGVGRKANLP